MGMSFDFLHISNCHLRAHGSRNLEDMYIYARSSSRPRPAWPGHAAAGLEKAIWLGEIMQNNMHSFGNLEDMFIQQADSGVPCNNMCNHFA